MSPNQFTKGPRRKHPHVVYLNDDEEMRAQAEKARRKRLKLPGASVVAQLREGIPK